MNIPPRALAVAVLVGIAVSLTALLIALQTQGLARHWKEYVDGLPTDRDGQ